MPHFDNELKESTLVNGVYFGWGYLPADGEILACVANIGKSPTFVNQVTINRIIISHNMKFTSVNIIFVIIIRQHHHPQENQVNIVEAHMLDRKVNTADFYGSSLRLCLIGFLRPEQKFGSFDALITQINADIEQTRQLCAGHQSSGPVKNGLAIATEFFKKDLKNPSSELLFQRIKIPLDN